MTRTRWMGCAALGMLLPVAALMWPGYAEQSQTKAQSAGNAARNGQGVVSPLRSPYYIPPAGGSQNGPVRLPAQAPAYQPQAGVNPALSPAPANAPLQAPRRDFQVRPINQLGGGNAAANPSISPNTGGPTSAARPSATNGVRLTTHAAPLGVADHANAVVAPDQAAPFAANTLPFNNLQPVNPAATGTPRTPGLLPATPTEGEIPASPLAGPPGRTEQFSASRVTPPHATTAEPHTSAAATLAQAQPGSKAVDGPQTPQVTIEKLAPAEVQVGQPAAFLLKIRNSGAVPAYGVQVTDAVPTGCQFVRSEPTANPGRDGMLLWKLGTMQPGEEQAITVELLPQAEGEIGSVAAVQFQAVVGVRTLAVRPALALAVSGPAEILAGEDVTLTIRISNPGSGVATNVVLEEHVPAALKHPGGSELELEIGTLKPGETKELDLILSSVHAGKVVNQLTARGDGGLRAETQCQFAVLAPELKIGVEGPTRRFLERQAIYTLTVANPGTAAAKDVELVAQLPRGLKFIKADNEGTYDAARHCVIWSLEELPAKEHGAVKLTTLPVEEGEQKLTTTGKARQGLVDQSEQLVVIEGVAAILFEVADLSDPIELNGETAYDVKITNQGSKEAANVQLVALLPAELEFLSAEGATRHKLEGNRLVFEPIARLPAKSETVYRLHMRGVAAGDVRLKVQLLTDDIRQPITKEESTRVFADE
ncbi:MAG: hypothetical protein SFX18_04555 [Pirellulales bacterium]|nr:hypothetical protein [Pirellulales bacterium]